MFPFSFTVVFYVEYNDETHENQYRRESGMGIASSYADAMRIVENYYGTDLIAVKHLELFEGNEVILMPETWIKEYAKDPDNTHSIACDADGNPLADVIEKGSNVYER